VGGQAKTGIEMLALKNAKLDQTEFEDKIKTFDE
jgi:hypothetical protein